MNRMRELMSNIFCGVNVILATPDGEVPAPENDDGYLGEKFSPDTKILIKMFMLARHDTVVFHVEKVGADNKCCVPVPGKPDEKGLVTYLKSVPLRKDPRSGYVQPDLFKNALWLICFEPDGSFQIGRLKIVAQDGKFFLSADAPYTDRAYRDDDGDVVVPRFEDNPALFYRDWPSMRTLIAAHYGENLLPSLSDYMPETPPDVSYLKANQGIVLWWSAEAHGGYGAIATHKGNAQVHWTKVASDERYKCLTPGDLVDFTDLEPTDPEKKSDFRLTAIGVRTIAEDPIKDIEEMFRILGE